MFKTDNQLSHPVTNGKTKFMILLSLIFLFVISILGMTYALIGAFHLNAIALYFIKGGFMGVAAAASGGIIYAVHSFFDTREAAQKSQDKLNREKAKYTYLIERDKIRLEMLKIKRGIR